MYPHLSLPTCFYRSKLQKDLREGNILNALSISQFRESLNPISDILLSSVAHFELATTSAEVFMKTTMAGDLLQVFRAEWREQSFTHIISNIDLGSFEPHQLPEDH